jgi:hypothetical protein
MALERGELLKRRKEICDKLYPEIRRGYASFGEDGNICWQFQNEKIKIDVVIVIKTSNAIKDIVIISTILSYSSSCVR